MSQGGGRTPLSERLRSYNVRYFDNIKLIGATFSTSVGAASIAGELSYKQGAPVLVKTLVNPRAPQAASSYLPTPTRADVVQANLNTIWNLERTAIADQTTLTAEVAYVTIGGIEATNAPGAASTTVFPKSKELFFGANYGLAASGTLSLGYPGIFEGWDLTVPISFSRQLKGRTITGGVGGEGDMRASIGANFTYQRNLQVGLTYMGYFGNAEVSNMREFRPLTDRDQLSLVMKYSF